MDTEQALEDLHCAQVNFQNIAKMAPQLDRHPIFALAMKQLADGIEKVEQLTEPEPPNAAA